MVSIGIEANLQQAGDEIGVPNAAGETAGWMRDFQSSRPIKAKDVYVTEIKSNGN
jgi:hypothetical protein